MIRDRNKTVINKESFDILIPASRAEAAGEATFGVEFGPPKPVRIFTKDDRQRAIKRINGKEGKLFDALLALRGALESRDALQIEAARARLERFYRLREDEDPPYVSKDPEIDRQFAEVLAQRSGLSPEEAIKHFEGLRPGPRAKSDPFRLLSYEVSQRVSGPLETELVLWWDGKEFRPAIYCSDHVSALYVHTFFLGRTRYRICPTCGERFEQLRPNQDYCTVAHREAHRVKRFRNAKKSQQRNKEKGGNNGTQETR